MPEMARGSVDASMVPGVRELEALKSGDEILRIFGVQEQVKMVGYQAVVVTGDAGYFSEAAVTDPRLAQVALLVPPDRQKHGQPEAVPNDPIPADAPVIDKMREKLRSPEGHAIYKLRKQVVEPVFGQIKEARGIRRFSFRGLRKVTAEWDIICLTHNLLKLFHKGAGWRATAAT